MDPVVDLLRELVAIDSVNPSLVEGGAGEAEIAHFVGEWMRRAGFDVRVDEIAPGRVNVVAIAEGAGDGPTRMLCGHTDTVGVDGMAAPFAPDIRDGRLYGRGAQDMKGGVAAMMAGAAAWLTSGRHGSGRVIVAAVADEEYASIGAEAVAREWRADEAVIPEPTDLDLGVAHKGFSCAEVVVHGRAAHGSRPADGRDAILRMGRLLNRIEAKDRSLRRLTRTCCSARRRCTPARFGAAARSARIPPSACSRSSGGPSPASAPASASKSSSTWPRRSAPRIPNSSPRFDCCSHGRRIWSPRTRTCSTVLARRSLSALAVDP